MSALKVRKPGPKLPTTGAVSIPAIPARRPVSAHVKLDRRRTEIPISSVATGSWLTPRMASPRLVREKNRPSSTASITSAARTRRRWSDTCTPKTETRFNRPRAGWMNRSRASPSQSSSEIASSDTPAVATSSVTRGASNSGLTTSRSVASAIATAAASPMTMASRSGTPIRSWTRKSA